MATTPQTQRGVTLVELLAAIAIMAILTSVAVPSFSVMRLNALRSSSMNALWHAIFLARSEAIKRNSVVSMCRSADGIRCNNTPGNWSEGWMVFDNLDHDEPAQLDSGEPVLRQFHGSNAIDIRVNPANPNGRKTFTFRSFAQSSANGTIVFCDSRGNSTARAIIISHTGRPRHSDRDANNKPLSCNS